MRLCEQALSANVYSSKTSCQKNISTPAMGRVVKTSIQKSETTDATLLLHFRDGSVFPNQNANP